MALTIAEFFGYAPNDPKAAAFAKTKKCPFVPAPNPEDLENYGKCIKPKHGACSLKQTNSESPVIACPNRLYAEDYRVLQDVASIAFGKNTVLVSKARVDELKSSGALTGREVAVFGKNWGSELSIPQNTSEENEAVGGFFIDYILARLDPEGNVVDFTAVEIQTIDTTGSYKEQASRIFTLHSAEPATEDQPDIDELSSAEAENSILGEITRGHNYFKGAEEFDAIQIEISEGEAIASSKAGFNWANVSKRILPQLIYKGYVLRREKLCSKGLFFVCPSAVLKKVKGRLGTKLLDYPIAAGTITFLAYDVSADEPSAGNPRVLTQVTAESLTTTVEQIAYAFVSPVNLPLMGVYEKAINAAMTSKTRRKKG